MAIAVVQIVSGAILCYVGCTMFRYHAVRLVGLKAIRDDLVNYRISPEEARRRLENLP